jgi:hypothetical protein
MVNRSRETKEDEMPNLTRYTLTYDERRNRWTLGNDRTNRVVKSFETKKDATRGGVLRNALGSGGGSVRIQKVNGRYQEERTYPRGRDPRHSRG